MNRQCPRSSRRRPTFTLVWALGVCGILTGCDDGRMDLAPVTGTVQYRGENIPYGKITFSVKGMRNGEAVIRDGKVTEPTTYEPNDGIPIGMAELGVHGFKRAPEVVKEKTAEEGKSTNPGQSSGCGPEVLPVLVDRKYNRPSTSELTFEVTAEGPNVLELNLE